jgi:quinohemoprotein amine dehydrogenase
MSRDQSDKIPSEALQHTCNYCHTIGRVLGQRRTKDDYEKLINMHLGLFPGAENTLRPRRAAGRSAEAPFSLSSPIDSNPAAIAPASPPKSDEAAPADVAIEYLSTAQPLFTPEWRAWKAVMRTPRLEGKWMLTGYQQGKGRVFGTLAIEPGAAGEEFTSKLELEYASTGITESRTGKGLVYTGYSWRGRSKASSLPPAASPPPDPSGSPAEWREALFVSRDGNTMDGRWFWGGYDEFGIDAHLTRVGSEPMLSGASVLSLQSPSTVELRVFGANFSPDLKPADLDFGTGITVTRIVRLAPTVATLAVQVDAALPNAIRDISLKRATAERAIAVYDKVAYIRTLPDASMARLGGVVAPKQYAQFEAIAYAAGPDGKPHTADDIPLGPVPVRWSMSEFLSTPTDDDVKFVGAISEGGLFTPNVEGPNPQRKTQQNNYPTNNWGDVWVEAAYQPPGSATAMNARSYLVVTIPLYMRYDQPEVAR